ncbi:MAG: hypothetical protein SX243_19130 [Acidobacteriota bacterium]|nr:hypothetical protein [Acidobacteriota bacterium]
MPRFGTVVADASPLISLEKIPGGFSLLANTCSRLLVPQAVAEEVSFYLDEGVDYFRHHGVGQSVGVEVVGAVELGVLDGIEPQELGRGELHAIALAHARSTPILIEERKGRRVARDQGLVVFGAAAVVKIAFEEGGVDGDEAESHLRALHQERRISRKVLTRMLEVLGRR